MGLSALGTLLNAAAMVAAIAVPDGGGYFDAFTAIHVGTLPVAASAAAIVRPAFFTFAGATAIGGAIGVPPWPSGVAGFVFLGLLIVTTRARVRHQRGGTRSASLSSGSQPPAPYLRREFLPEGPVCFRTGDP